MPDTATPLPDETAVRTALWRALHVLADPPPHVFTDEVGLALAAPDPTWRERPDMSPFTRPFRASIVARARFLEGHVASESARGVDQYVILGAGLDTLAQRAPTSPPGSRSSRSAATASAHRSTRKSCSSPRRDARGCERCNAGSVTEHRRSSPTSASPRWSAAGPSAARRWLG